MREITGRDRHITVTALAYAIAAIERLPIERREQSDAHDMKILLASMVKSDAELEMVTASALRHIEG